MVARGVETEPTVDSAPMPVILFVLLSVLLFWGMTALDRTGGGFHNRVYPPYESYTALLNAQPKSGDDEIIAKGQQVYTVTCSLCHQPNGLGTPGQFPPLDGSEWVTGNEVGRRAGEGPARPEVTQARLVVSQRPHAAGGHGLP